MLVCRLEGVGGREDFLFELYAEEKKTNGGKILPLQVKQIGRLSALRPLRMELF